MPHPTRRRFLTLSAVASAALFPARFAFDATHKPRQRTEHVPPGKPGLAEQPVDVGNRVHPATLMYVDVIDVHGKRVVRLPLSRPVSLTQGDSARFTVDMECRV